MNKITYIPTKDELSFTGSQTAMKKPSYTAGQFSIWWTDDGEICAVTISSFIKELKEFKKDFRRVKLGGIWGSLRISDLEIKNTRKDMLKRLEDKW